MIECSDNNKTIEFGARGSTPMQRLQAETRFANTDLKGEVMVEAQERLAQAIGSPTTAAAGTGMAGNLAAMYRQDPLKAEAAFRDRLDGFSCSVSRDTFGQIMIMACPWKPGARPAERSKPRPAMG